MRSVVAWLTLFGALAVGVPGSARAADGCTVLLCLAGNWRNISQCVPPVREALRDLALGRSFPGCSMGGGGSGGGNTGAQNRMLTGNDCPGPYAVPVYQDGTLIRWDCTVTGAVTVTVSGAPWSVTYWDMGGNAITEWSPAAKAQLGAGNYDTAYDDAFARWLQSPDYIVWNCAMNGVCPPPAPCPGGGDGC